jgi:hypothetical protein
VWIGIGVAIIVWAVFIRKEDSGGGYFSGPDMGFALWILFGLLVLLSCGIFYLGGALL